LGEAQLKLRSYYWWQGEGALAWAGAPRFM